MNYSLVHTESVTVCIGNTTVYLLSNSIQTFYLKHCLVNNDDISHIKHHLIIDCTIYYIHLGWL